MTSTQYPKSDKDLVGAFTGEGTPKWANFVLGAPIVVLVLIPMLLWQGYAIMMVWNWHLTPLGLPEMTMTGAIGVSLVVGMLTTTTKFKDQEVNLKSTLFNEIFVPFMALVIGYVMYRWF